MTLSARESAALAAEMRDPVGRVRVYSRLQCRRSLVEFVRQGWHVLEPSTPFVDGKAVRAIASCLEAVTDGRIHNLLVNVPPGFSKSMLVNVFWPAWEWGCRGLPHHRFISASYEQGLATRDLVRCRDLITSEWYQDRWPLKLKEDVDAKTNYANMATGWRFAASVRAALTGWRADRILIDDPHSVKGAESEAEIDESGRWFTETIPTRLNRKQSSKVLIMQRLSTRDLSGIVFDTMRDDWTCLVLPMEFEVDVPPCVVPEVGFQDWRTEEGELLWPERFDRDYVETLKRAFRARGGEYAVAGQLQQRPVPRGGGMFKREKVGFVDSVPTTGRVRRVRGWDLAATAGGNGSKTVGLKLAIVGGKYYVEDVASGRVDSLGVENMIVAASRQDGKSVPQSLPQDPGQAAVGQKKRLASLLDGRVVHFSLESGEKLTRAGPISAQWEAGNVYLVRGAWNDSFVSAMEMVSPSNARGRDEMDALSRAHSYLLTHDNEQYEFGPPGFVVGGD